MRRDKWHFAHCHVLRTKPPPTGANRFENGARSVGRPPPRSSYARLHFAPCSSARYPCELQPVEDLLARQHRHYLSGVRMRITTLQSAPSWVVGCGRVARPFGFARCHRRTTQTANSSLRGTKQPQPTRENRSNGQRASRGLEDLSGDPVAPRSWGRRQRSLCRARCRQ